VQQEEEKELSVRIGLAHLHQLTLDLPGAEVDQVKEGDRKALAEAQILAAQDLNALHILHPVKHQLQDRHIHLPHHHPVQVEDLMPVLQVGQAVLVMVEEEDSLRIIIDRVLNI
jgi:hypothetical protein